MENTLWSKLFQGAIVLPTALVAVLLLHWSVVQPVPIDPGEHELAFFATAILKPDIPWSGYAHFVTFSLGLMATTALVACALAATLALRVPNQISARRLALALVGASVATSYFFFITPHAEYRAAIGWTPDSPLRLVCDF